MHMDMSSWNSSLAAYGSWTATMPVVDLHAWQWNELFHKAATAMTPHFSQT